MTGYDYIQDGTRSTSAPSPSSAPRPTCRAFRDDEADVAIRMIHACGQVEAARHFVFSQDFVAAARAALAAGAPIFCDAEMVAHGVTRARLPAGNEVICTLRDPRTAGIAARHRQHPLGRGDRTVGRAAWPVRVVAIGNAPTALFYLLEKLRDGAPKPAAIIGMPVGFVGAAESKDALAEKFLGMPFAIVRGRMGGSAMTAAAVNATGEARPVNAQRQRPPLSASAPAPATRSC